MIVGNRLIEHLTSLQFSMKNSVHRNYVSTHYSYYLTPVSPLNSFFLSPSDFQKIVEGLRSKISYMNTYSVTILKYLNNLISTILSELSNQSLMTCTFPGLFKQARVTHIFKSGYRKHPKNYRPFSVLPVLSKVFEKSHLHSSVSLF